MRLKTLSLPLIFSGYIGVEETYWDSVFSSLVRDAYIEELIRFFGAYLSMQFVLGDTCVCLAERSLR